MGYAFNTLGVKGLFAGHNPANEASRRLLEKLGFRYTHDEYYPPTGLNHPSYRLTAEEFAQRQEGRVGLWATWKDRAQELKRETYALYLACRDPRTPWYGRALAACVVGYAFSPIDLIPDFIPVLGYLDDLILIPVGIALVLKVIPSEVMAECRVKAAVVIASGKPTNWIAAGIIVGIWVLLAVAGMWIVIGWLK